MSDDFPDVTASYDGGMFDKDEQGWVECWTKVARIGPLVLVTIAGHETRGGIEAWHRALGIVVLRMADGRERFFDLEARRLLDRTPRDLRRDLGPLAPTPEGIAALARMGVRAGAALDARIGAIDPTLDAAALVFERPDPARPGETAKVRLGPTEGDAAVEVLVWRNAGAAPHGARARTAAAYPADYVAVSIDGGRATIQTGAPLDVQERAAAAARAALAAS